jgi:hypothetical protein
MVILTFNSHTSKPSPNIFVLSPRVGRLNRQPMQAQANIGNV